MKFLAMHITNQKLSFDIFTVGNLLNIFMEHDLNILMILLICFFAFFYFSIFIAYYLFIYCALESTDFYYYLFI